MGALYDFVGVYYFKSFVDKRASSAAFLSMWLGTASLLGLETALQGRLAAAGLILGYGAGTYAATRWLP